VSLISASSCPHPAPIGKDDSQRRIAHIREKRPAEWCWGLNTIGRVRQVEVVRFAHVSLVTVE